MFWRILRSTSSTKRREIQMELWIANNKTKMILSAHKNNRNHRIHLPESESSSIIFASVNVRTQLFFVGIVTKISSFIIYGLTATGIKR